MALLVRKVQALQHTFAEIGVVFAMMHMKYA